jgi:superfamily I DNA/RNA helicase
MKKLELTDELKDILSLNIEDISILLIQALAGTGKTTTLLEIIKRNQKFNFLYLAFNNKIVEDIKKKTSFKEEYKNVFPKTIHAYALLHTRSFFEEKNKNLENKLTFDLVSSVLPDAKTFEIYSIIKWFNLYCNQVLDFKEYKQFIKKLSNKEKFDLQIHERKDYILSILKKVEILYKKMLNGDAKFYTHNLYLKYFIDNMESFDYDDLDILLVDEAQDLNPVMLKLVYILIKKNKKFIGVGDDNQSIYAFMNNINLLKEFMNKKDNFDIIVKHLSYSFRFKSNSMMENYANLILDYRGLKIKGFSTDDNEDIKDTLLLGRSNAQVFWNAYILASENKHFLLIGGIDKELQTFFEDINYIINKQSSKVKSKLLKEFSDGNQLKAFAQKENDQEILSAMTLLKKLSDSGIKLFDFFKLIKKFNKNDFYLKARPNPTYLSTIHKAKGLEFDEVELLSKLNDNVSLIGFKYNTTVNGKILLKSTPHGQTIEELNLLYVAVTRAKKSITVCNEEYVVNFKFLKSKMKFSKTIILDDSTLERANSQYEYLSNEFIPISIDNWNFLINMEEFEKFKEILKNK